MRRAEKLWSLIKRAEGRILKFIKENRLRFLLDFFRKHSGVLVVVFVTCLVAVGNVNSKESESGFLLSPDDLPNEEKIKKRAEKYAHRQSINEVSLDIFNSQAAGEEDVADIMLKNENLAENQLQYQVLTATVPDAKKLLEEGADVAVYLVESGDTVGSIAQKFSVTANTILWANDIDNPNMIMPGDKIFILPTTGVKHVVKEGETIDKIAKKYEAEEEKIIAFNELPADGAIKLGAELIIPDGIIEQPAATPGNVLDRRTYYSQDVAGDTNRDPSIIDRNPKGGHSFPYGYCTWYVAQHKYVPWGGNAGTWLYHAKAYGAKTGKAPKEGAIIVTSESWYGHVGIVTKVKGDQITIKEMNYKGFAIASTRTIPTSSRVIKGYIY